MDHNKLWEILEEMGIPDHLTCLLRNLYADQEATVRSLHRTLTGTKLEKEYVLSPCSFNLFEEYVMRNAGLHEAQAGIKVAGEISITSDTQMTPPSWQKAKRN